MKNKKNKKQKVDRKPVVNAASIFADCLNDEIRTQRDALLKENTELREIIINIEKRSLKDSKL